ncbi:MAG TPA: NAD(+) diphosphatase [Steroidobacteraceae bacterium]
MRTDDAWVEDVLCSCRARIVPIHDSRSLLVRSEAGYEAVFPGSSAFLQDCCVARADTILLGQQDGLVYFAVELTDPAPALRHAQGAAARFEDLRTTAGQLPERQAGVLAYARAMVHWRRRHRYCGACGAPTVSASAGHVMKCTDPGCGTDHFPRLDPAIIVLVSDGERALLGRQASWPEGRYSTIAGFVEPGESLEDAVAREVLEETGVTVLDSDYHSSQPWPFPSSLMIGFTARAAADAVPRPDEELEDVRWFTREEIAAGCVGLPPPQSVSFRLIEHWYDAGSGVPLRDSPGLRLWGSRRR